MFKPSPRAVAIAASFALGLSLTGPAAHAGLLDGVLGGGGIPIVSDVLGGDLLGGGIPIVSDVLGGELLGGSSGGGIPIVSDVLGGELLGGEMLTAVTDTALGCDAAIPQVLRSLIGDVADVACEPFSDGIAGLLGSL